MNDAPSVYLVRNPWPRTVPDGVLLQYLQTASINAQLQMREWLEAGKIDESQDSFGAVFLDPTRPRWAHEFSDRVMAINLIGPRAVKYVPNGASKADGHDLHGINMGEIVEKMNHLLADGTFGWGNSAEFDGAIGGGSGLSVKQDGIIVLAMLTTIVNGVRTLRSNWLADQRQLKPEAGHRWFDPDDEPDPQYANVVDLLAAEGTKTISEIAA